MNRTQPVDWINQPKIGYMVNTEFSEVNKAKLLEVIQEIDLGYQSDIFCTPPDSLHITLLDWVAPLVDYDGQDKDRLYESVFEVYDQAMSEVTSSSGPIEVKFDEIRVSPSTIFITGRDDGSFQRIRSQFLKKVELLPGTKLPPDIIHSSLARFTAAIDLGEVSSFIASRTIDFTEVASGFRLVRSSIEPLIDYRVIKRYEL